jgi:hypothetical protein
LVIAVSYYGFKFIIFMLRMFLVHLLVVFICFKLSHYLGRKEITLIA